jgi:hypothetical protein
MQFETIITLKRCKAVAIVLKLSNYKLRYNREGLTF